MRLRLHVIGIPHSDSTEFEWWTPFMLKVWQFCDLMSERGHQVFLYSGPRNEGVCVEHIDCTTRHTVRGRVPEFDVRDPAFSWFNKTVEHKLRPRLEPRDILCFIGGNAQRPIANAFPKNLSVEIGIGYAGTFAQFRIFESYAWMHTVYGADSAAGAETVNGGFYDAVIPNAFDPKEFPFGDGDGDYLLYIGRLIERKGLEIVIRTAQEAEMDLKVIGEGDYKLPSFVDRIPSVTPEQRATYLGSATALLLPTLYIEPFGRVVVEAQMCGTPAITTDWGAFVETVEPGFNGFRCRIIQQFVDAALDASTLDRGSIRQRAIDRYSPSLIADRYEAYFEQLETLWGDGFYQMKKNHPEGNVLTESA